MAALAIGDDLEQHGTLPVFDDVELAPEGVDDRQRVVAVDGLGMEIEFVDPGSEAGQAFEPHRLTPGLAAHAVEIIHEAEDDRQASLVGLGPEIPELAHGGEIHRLPDGSAAAGGVADIGYRDPTVALKSHEERGAHGDIRASADYGVIGVGAEGQEEGVHGAAKAAVEAGGPSEDFRQESEDEKFLGPFLPIGAGLALEGLPDLSIERTLDDDSEVFFGKLVDRAESLGEELPVAAMASEDVISRFQHEGLSNSCRLLSDREVGGPLVVVLESLVAAHLLDLVEHRLELPDDDHIPVDQEGLVGAYRSVRDLLGKGPGVGIGGNFPDLGRRWATDVVGIHYQALDHIESFFFSWAGSLPNRRVY